ncbi:MAG: site-specific integrase [Cyclobacteriaceae bacterium]|nr:site-specific integrase [Cyclobacteriaceae bacterium]
MNLSYVFNRNNLNNKSGKYTVSIRVNVDGKSDYLKIFGFPKLEKKYWDFEKKCVGNSHPHQSKLNSILNREKEKLDRYYIDELDKQRILNLKDIRHFYENQKERESFNEFVAMNHKKYIKDNELEHRTFQVYRTFLTHLNDFNAHIRFYELSRELVIDFNNFLIKKKKLKGASRKKYLDKFKVMYKEAAKAKLVAYDELLFDKLKIKVEHPIRTALTIDEIKKIRDHELTGNPALLQCRDEFMFMCYSGLYYGDLRKLKEGNLVLHKEKYVISGERSKNNNRFIIPIYKFPQAIDIIKRYKDTTEDEYLFPNTISDQKFNVKLKGLAKAVGIKKNLTNKVARHSFTDLMIASGEKEQMVSKMLGHTKTETTREYYNMNIEHLINSRFSDQVIDL